MSDFKIQYSWRHGEDDGTEIGATRCLMRILLKDSVITTFAAEHLAPSDQLDIPAYYFAEWLAENWWPLLWEPRKSDDDAPDDPDFLSRHSALTAQHGFALPNLLIVPNGDYVNLSAKARDNRYADVRFKRGGSALTPRVEVEAELARFVSATVEQIEKATVAHTDLQDYWKLIVGTGDDEQLYCRLLGALGLSPYAKQPSIDNVLFDAVDSLGEQMAMDLCLVARPADLAGAAAAAKLAKVATREAPVSDLSRITSLRPAPESLGVPAWRRGVQAARQMKASLGIGEADPTGGSRLLEALEVDPNKRVSVEYSDSESERPAIMGAVVREDRQVRIALLQQSKHQRRFAAARGIYSAWISGPSSSRLMTQAVTRDQQSSRAFAAEAMAPIAFIRSQAKKQALTFQQISDLASELGIGADVIKKQAQNSGLMVSQH